MAPSEYEWPGGGRDHEFPTAPPPSPSALGASGRSRARGVPTRAGSGILTAWMLIAASCRSAKSGEVRGQPEAVRLTCQVEAAADMVVAKGEGIPKIKEIRGAEAAAYPARCLEIQAKEGRVYVGFDLPTNSPQAEPTFLTIANLTGGRAQAFSALPASLHAWSIDLDSMRAVETEAQAFWRPPANYLAALSTMKEAFYPTVGRAKYYKCRKGWPASFVPSKGIDPNR